MSQPNRITIWRQHPRLQASQSTLAVVFGTGLFAGWQFGTGSGADTGVLQPGIHSGSAAASLNGENLEEVRQAVVAKVRPAVVQVNVATSQGQGLGSGVIIDQRGYIITNHHVVERARQIQVMLYDGTTLPAQLVGASSPDDLAVLKVTPKEKLSVATLGDSSQVRVGQEVLAIGKGTFWAWIVWIVVGGLAGALADRLIQGDKLGILGNIVIGIIGGLIGGAILGLFGLGGDGILWTFLTAFLGAALLLWLINAITAGRGIGKRARRG